MDCYWFTRVTTRALSVIAGGALACLPLAASAEIQPHADHGAPPADSDVASAAFLGGTAQRTDGRGGRPRRTPGSLCDG